MVRGSKKNTTEFTHPHGEWLRSNLSQEILPRWNIASIWKFSKEQINEYYYREFIARIDRSRVGRYLCTFFGLLLDPQRGREVIKSSRNDDFIRVRAH